MVFKKVLALGKRAYVWLGEVGVGVGVNPPGRSWGCRRGFGVVGCPALASNRVTNGGAFCNKGVHQGGVWARRTSMEGKQ